MASEREEIWWALHNVDSFIQAVKKANIEAGNQTATLNQIEKDWITCKALVITRLDELELAQNYEAEAQALVDYTLEKLKIPKQSSS